MTSVDVHSKEFDSLPPEVQHELLLERQQIEKYSYHDPDTLPQVRSFSMVTYRVCSGEGENLLNVGGLIIAHEVCEKFYHFL